MSPTVCCLVLFARMDAVAMLEHSLRRGLLERLRGRPGACLAELAEALRVDATTVRYHARLLERAGHVVSIEHGRRRLLYLSDDPRRHTAPPRVALALAAVRAGAATPHALGRALGLPRGTAGSLLDAMAGAGLLERDGPGWRLTRLAESRLAAEGAPRSAS